MCEKNSEEHGDICAEDIHKLLEHSVKNAHKVKDGDLEGEFIMERCLLLLTKDYKYSVITNFNGELCGHYPSKIVLLEYQMSVADKKTNQNEEVQSFYDTGKLRELIKQARYARCRSRFAVPVILYEGKHICRSATLASGAEMYGRSGLDFLFSGPGTDPLPSMSMSESPLMTSTQTDPQMSASTSTEPQMFDRFRGQDIKLLKHINVSYICDLMVEKKKVKFGMNITSSEKVDKENRYADFSIISIPYPGCEFFKEWKDNSYLAETMTFDWSQNFVDAILDIPDNPLLSQLGIDWKRYRNWDIIQLTQNYLKLFLHILREGDTGILVHCISGWDRTPMFISLLRLSLWADGVAHATLSPAEILYLTLAYDWYLFGHNLPDRVNKGEEILFFCFSFLRYISSDEFSVNKGGPRKVSRTDSECNIDGVLLDADQRRLSYRGSNTSISSIGSVDNGPIVFNTPEEDKTPTANGSPGVMLSNQVKYSNPSTSSASSSSRNPPESPIQFQFNHYSTSPVMVPGNVCNRTNDPQRTGSPACGSWQVISSSGSLRGFVSSTDSLHSAGSSNSSKLSSCQEATEIQETTRFQKLDAVRRIFSNAYTNKIVTKPGSWGAGRGITNLLDQFAEKVGFRTNRNTFV